MFGFGKRITEEFTADCFVRGLLADVDEAYPSVFKQIELLGVARFSDNLSEIVCNHVFALEMIALQNFFSDDRAKRLRRLCVGIGSPLRRKGLGRRYCLK